MLTFVVTTCHVESHMTYANVAASIILGVEAHVFCQARIDQKGYECMSISTLKQNEDLSLLVLSCNDV